jgi:hypothetical protein
MRAICELNTVRHFERTSLTLVALSASLLAGCSTLMAGFVVSATANAIGGVSMDADIGHRSEQTSSVKMGPFNVRLIPYNWRGTEDLPEFVVAIDFAAYPIKGNFGDLRLDPRAVVLKAPDGALYRVHAWARTYPDGPPSLGCNLSDGSHRQFPRAPPTIGVARYFVRDTPIQVGGHRSVSDCLNLYFPVARIDPSAQFSVTLGGVEYDGVKYPPVEVAFAQHHGR